MVTETTGSGVEISSHSVTYFIPPLEQVIGSRASSDTLSRSRASAHESCVLGGSRHRHVHRRQSEPDEDRLEARGRARIMYTHFPAGFGSDETLNPPFRELMERLPRTNGWFVPVTTILEYPAERRGPALLAIAHDRRIERCWLLSTISAGYSLARSLCPAIRSRNTKTDS